ncbi:MAG: 50S ribosomal protein L32e [Candidatus Odinarchaeum yellowstonii]|uniref:Large ribosomal subunit protein eL32 n=1 Tax=Odinarchaeota yellowstonii (strain LCB_4) TaxID=1841599 RepID=A0AAF0D1A9_ODILC|nr:MAG: 50S ribosomal protein L32e [Candidatus Odinarchaeum yellowstonii]
MSETTKLIKLREKIKNHKPEFIRQESWKYKRLSEAWRRPRGLDNKVRKCKKGYIKMPSIGYRSPRKVRGYHPTGKIEVLVENINQLDLLDPSKHIIRLSAKLGMRKKTEIAQATQQKGLLITNLPLRKEEAPEKWEKLTELETEELKPELDEKYTEELEKEGALKGLPEYEVEEKEETSKPKKTVKKTRKTSKKEEKSESEPKKEKQSRTGKVSKKTVKKVDEK